MSRRDEERRPYNPFHLASGHAAESLPDKKTAAVFKTLCNHSDYLGGSITVGVETIMRETKYSRRAVEYALATLTTLGRITRHPRGIGGQRGGRQSAVTTVHCTEEELRRAGANDENFFDKGGKAGLFKPQIEPIQTAKRVHSNRKSEVFKPQRDAQKPLLPSFTPKPLQAEPLQVSVTVPSAPKNKSQEKPSESAFMRKGGKVNQPQQHRKANADRPPMPSVSEKQLIDSAAPPPAADAPAVSAVGHLQAYTVEKLRAYGCPESVIARIGELKGWSKALNKTPNVITAYHTMANREFLDNGTPNKVAEELKRKWLPKKKAALHRDENMTDDDFVWVMKMNSPEQKEKERLEEIKEEERKRERKQYLSHPCHKWWNTLSVDDQKKYTEEYSRHRKGWMGIAYEAVVGKVEEAPCPESKEEVSA